MHRRAAGVTLLLPLLAACAGHATGSGQTHVLAEQTTRSAAPCNGWFVISGSTLTVHLGLLTGARSVDVTAATTDNGDVPLGVAHIVAGNRNATLRFNDVTDGVQSLTVHISGQPATASCTLTSPH